MVRQRSYDDHPLRHPNDDESSSQEDALVRTDQFNNNTSSGGGGVLGSDKKKKNQKIFLGDDDDDSFDPAMMFPEIFRTNEYSHDAFPSIPRAGPASENNLNGVPMLVPILDDDSSVMWLSPLPPDHIGGDAPSTADTSSVTNDESFNHQLYPLYHDDSWVTLEAKSLFLAQYLSLHQAEANATQLSQGTSSSSTRNNQNKNSSQDQDNTTAPADSVTADDERPMPLMHDSRQQQSELVIAVMENRFDEPLMVSDLGDSLDDDDHRGGVEECKESEDTEQDTEQQTAPVVTKIDSIQTARETTAASSSRAGCCHPPTLEETADVFFAPFNWFYSALEYAEETTQGLCGPSAKEKSEFLSEKRSPPAPSPCSTDGTAGTWPASNARPHHEQKPTTNPSAFGPEDFGTAKSSEP